MKFTVDKNGMLQPDPSPRKKKIYAARMALLFGAFAAFDIIAAQFVPDGVGLGVIFLSMPCIFMAIIWLNNSTNN